MHESLCNITGVQHDPCVIDVFMSVVSFMEGGAALSWWSFTEKRKQIQAGQSRRKT
ncbi:MAG: helix-hairpin-helix domain-containing protein [Burkholderiaceae bacterium]